MIVLLWPNITEMNSSSFCHLKPNTVIYKLSKGHTNTQMLTLSHQNRCLTSFINPHFGCRHDRSSLLTAISVLVSNEHSDWKLLASLCRNNGQIRGIAKVFSLGDVLANPFS